LYLPADSASKKIALKYLEVPNQLSCQLVNGKSQGKALTRAQVNIILNYNYRN